jgi:glycosyltransferase involved in cell wall biosynthesis
VRFLDWCLKRVELPPAEDIASRILGRRVGPIVLDYWKRYPKGLDHFVAQLAIQHNWTAVIIEYIWLYPAAHRLHSILRLLDTQDLQHKRVAEFASRGLIFPLPITRDEEAGVFKHFDAIIAIQAAEAADIKAMCPEVSVLTVGSMGSHSSKPFESHAVHGRVLYVGGFNGANIDGLNRFLRVSWPRICEEDSRTHLHVCGYVYRGFLREQFDRVTFLGHVEDIEQEYAEAAVVINPSWIGTGLKIKSVEALARGKPLVSTRKGVDGLPENVKKSAFISDDDVEFADCVIRLVRDSCLRKLLCEAARGFAMEYLTVQTVYGEFLSYLDRATLRPLAERKHAQVL